MTSRKSNQKLTKTERERLRYLEGLFARQAKASVRTRKPKLPCPRGKIVRRATVVKRGGKGKRKKVTYRRASCIRDTGKPGKGIPGQILVKEGRLGIYGYKNVKQKTQAERRRALNKAAKKEGELLIIRRLNALANLTNKSDPAFSRRVRADQEYMSRKRKKRLKSKGG